MNDNRKDLQPPPKGVPVPTENVQQTSKGTTAPPAPTSGTQNGMPAFQSMKQAMAGSSGGFGKGK